MTGDPSLPDPTKWDGRYTEDDLDLHRRMVEALRGLPGYEFDFLNRHAELSDRLAHDPPDFALNFCDTGFRNVATQELLVPALFEVHGIPYSGTPPAGMVLCYDKAIVRLVAQAHGVPVPGEVYLPAEQDDDRLEAFLREASFPAIIKPSLGDGSVGIRPDAVVETPAEARRYLEWFRSELPGRAALLQEYLPGPEYGLALVGNPETGFTAFPPLEVDYGELPDDLAPILAFESKTGPATPYEKVAIQPASLPADELARLRRDAELLFGRLQCRDYARFDFRTGADGVVRLMEVNPNPAWSPEAKLALMARFAGLDYPGLLEKILETGQARLAAAG